MVSHLGSCFPEPTAQETLIHRTLDIDFDWNPPRGGAGDKDPVTFEGRMESMRQYRAVHDHVKVPQNFSEGDGAGKNLGVWVKAQRQSKKNVTLSAKKIAMLNGKSSWIVFSRADRSGNSHPSHIRYRF